MFMLEPQHGTFSEEDDLETIESDADRSIQIGLSNHDWLTEINRQVMPMESQSICSQEMDILGYRLNLECRN